MSYHIASSLKEALGLLKETGDKTRVVAGATDLFLQGLPDRLIDLGRLPETTVLEEKAGLLLIGAAVTHADAAASPLVRDKAAALAEACSRVGSPQVRNIGTVGGNVVTAAPAADAAVALVALGARAVVIDKGEQIREAAVEDLYAAYNRSVVDSTSEILLRLVLEPCAAGEGSAFLRFAARKALALPMVNAAARVRVSGGSLDQVRLVVAPVKPAPTRLRETESKLRGEPLTAETWRQAAEAAAAEAVVRGSLLRCSARYRRHLVGVLAGRVLQKAVERALGREVDDF